MKGWVYNFCQLHINKTKILFWEKCFQLFFPISAAGNCCPCEPVSSGGCHSFSLLSAEAWEHEASCVSEATRGHLTCTFKKRILDKVPGKKKKAKQTYKSFCVQNSIFDRPEENFLNTPFTAEALLSIHGYK